MDVYQGNTILKPGWLAWKLVLGVHCELMFLGSLTLLLPCLAQEFAFLSCSEDSYAFRPVMCLGFPEEGVGQCPVKSILQF